MSTSREAFEAWARSVMPGCDISMLQGAEGVYSNIFLEESWTAYQAARRAALEEAAKVCEQIASDHESDAAMEKDSDYAERYRVYAKHERRCAAAIRALADETQEG